ncbi:MAG: hypothetical protein JWM24_1653 [Solirubrobacterales bacterium]|nr:hypothetical protein [Solirubrobacterales bacterium]
MIIPIELPQVPEHPHTNVGLSEMAAKALLPGKGTDPAALPIVLSQAVGYYLNQRQENPPGWAYPSFLPSSDGIEPSLEVPLELGLWEALRREAERQEVAPDRLLQHASLYFGAARDSGHLTESIEEGLQGEDGD